MKSFFSQRGLPIRLQHDEDPVYVGFTFRDRNLRLYYEKPFAISEGDAWALNTKPGFTIMGEHRIIGVFDAKNYAADEEEVATIKMLAEMTNLDVGLGGLFFPQPI